jgi:PAS domain S-box-containing protein
MTTADTAVLHRRIIDHMNEGVWVVDAQGRTTYVNPRLCSMMGCSSDEVIGKSALNFLDARSRTVVCEVDRRLRAKGHSSTYEITVIGKNNEPIPVLVSGTPLPDGGSIGIMLDLRDVKRKDSLYRKLVENMNEAVWMGDAQERTVYANPKFCDLMGYTLKEMLGRQSYEFWDDASAQRVREVNASHRKRGISSSYEGILVAKDGRRIPVLLSGTPLPEGGTIGIMTDLTELKRKEEKERALSRAVTHARDAIIICDAKGYVQSWNRGAKILFGYGEKDMVGTSLTRVFPEDVRAMLSGLRTRFTGELKARGKNRRTSTVSVTISRVDTEGEDRETLSFLIIARDITDQRAFEEELTVKYQKMRDAYSRFGAVRRQMEYVFELIDVASQYSDPTFVAQFIVSAVIMLTRVDACVLRSFDSKRKTLDLLSCSGVTGDWEGKASIEYAGSLAEKAVEQKMPLKIIDITAEPRYSTPQLARTHSFTSLLLIPLQYRGALIGTLSLYVRPENKRELFEQEFIEQYARLIAFVLSATRF